MRQLNSQEMELIKRLAEGLDEQQRATLFQDLSNAQVLAETPSRAVLTFHIPGYCRPEYLGQHTFGAEGRLLDKDGVEVSVLMYADANNRLLELELIRWGDGDCIDPQMETLRLFK